MRPHIALQDAVDPRLVSLAGCLEILQHRPLDAHGDLFREVGFNQLGLAPEGFVEFGNVAEVDILVPRGRDLGGCEGLTVSATRVWDPCRP